MFVIYPTEHHFHIAKLGYAGVDLFLLLLLQNIDCGYSLEPPPCFEQKLGIKNHKKNPIENFQFLKLRKKSVYYMALFS